MIKYILAITLMAYSFVGCENDSTADEVPPQDEMQEDMQRQIQEQMQQQAIDIDVSDEELQLFVDVSMQAQEVQAEAQQEMLAIVEEEGIDVDTFNQIAQALQMGQSRDEIDVESEDMENFDKASESIDVIGQAMEGKLISAVESEGMEMDRFQELNMAIQQDQQLQQRAQQMMQESMQQAPSEGQ